MPLHTIKPGAKVVIASFSYVQIQSAKDPERHYRLEDVNLSLPKWGSLCGWDTEDDQKLLLGCYWYNSCFSFSFRFLQKIGVVQSEAVSLVLSVLI